MRMSKYDVGNNALLKLNSLFRRAPACSKLHTYGCSDPWWPRGSDFSANLRVLSTLCVPLPCCDLGVPFFLRACLCLPLLALQVIASLPDHVKKQVIEAAKRRQRMRSRAQYMPVAGNPAMYSQTQLSNFLRSKQLNAQVCTSTPHNQSPVLRVCAAPVRVAFRVQVHCCLRAIEEWPYE